MAKADTKRGTNTSDIVRVAHSLKWKWGGNVARMDLIRLQAAMWDVRTGKRRTE
jgi:hypothetical protein